MIDPEIVFSEPISFGKSIRSKDLRLTLRAARLGRGTD